MLWMNTIKSTWRMSPTAQTALLAKRALDWKISHSLMLIRWSISEDNRLISSIMMSFKSFRLCLNSANCSSESGEWWLSNLKLNAWCMVIPSGKEKTMLDHMFHAQYQINSLTDQRSCFSSKGHQKYQRFWGTVSNF